MCVCVCVRGGAVGLYSYANRRCLLRTVKLSTEMRSQPMFQLDYWNANDHCNKQLKNLWVYHLYVCIDHIHINWPCQHTHTHTYSLRVPLSQINTLHCTNIQLLPAHTHTWRLKRGLNVSCYQREAISRIQHRVKSYHEDHNVAWHVFFYARTLYNDHIGILETTNNPGKAFNFAYTALIAS